MTKHRKRSRSLYKYLTKTKSESCHSRRRLHFSWHVIKEFRKSNAKLIGVLGNNDGEKNGILKSFIDIGGELKGELGEVEFDGLKFCVYHGTDNEVRENITHSQKYDILICGHTHKREPQRSGTIKNNKETFVLNPGSAHRRKVLAYQGFLMSWANNTVRHPNQNIRVCKFSK